MNVAFIMYKRVDLTQQVFDRIAEARPERLMVIADGPKTPADQRDCESARAVIDQVDWPREVTKDYGDENKGCKRRVSSGLD